MRCIHYSFIVAASLLPRLAQAQFNSFEPGAYILNSTPAAVQKGELKFRGGDQLLVKDATGQKLKLTPKEVAAFRIGDDKYVAVGHFTLEIGLGGTEVDQAFAKPVDTGQVQLLHYEFSGYNYSGSAYLLRTTADATTVALVRNGASAGRRFREAVRPFLISRPEFVKYLDEKRINLDNLATAIHALNHNLPFTPPAALNLE